MKYYQQPVSASKVLIARAWTTYNEHWRLNDKISQNEDYGKNRRYG